MKNKKLFILAPVVLCSLVACSSGVHHESSEYMLELDYQNDFTILQLSDIHLAAKDNRAYQLEFLDSTIQLAKSKGRVDLIVATGDLFTFADRATAKDLFTFFEKEQIPWTVTFGNHDEQCYFPIDWMTGYLNDLCTTQGSYCLFKDIQDDDVFGNANFAINLKQGNNIFEQVIIMDSNRYNYGDYWGYDCIHQDQIDWYSDLVDATSSLNGGNVVDSLLFMHIPFPEFADAWEEHEAGNLSVDHGVKGEGISAPKYNSGFFDKIVEKGSTKAVCVGHDHVSDWCIQYQGVYLSYGVDSTDRIYYDEGLLGGKTITVHSDHSISFNEILNTYGDK